MKKNFRYLCIGLLIAVGAKTSVTAQISLLQDYTNTTSATIGTFQGITFKEAGFSALYPIAGTNGKEFWTCSDRGVNIDAANANPATCRPTYDKIYAFPNYAPKIHRIRINGDSIQILQTITMKRPNGTGATGIINPTGLGSTAAELASTDTVLNCLNFPVKTTAKDTFGIDAEGLVVDKDGNFWICEEGGPSIWKLNKSGVVVTRFTPYAILPGKQSVDIMIDSVFKYRKNNRGFEGIAITPNGKIYAIIQSPILYPTKSVGENTRIHRILEIDPTNNATRMFVYLNDGIIGSGSNQIRLRDWKIGDMAAINNTEFLVLEAALRGTTDIKRMYKIDISGATSVHAGLYGGKTLEELVDAAGLSANGIVPVSKTLAMDLLANGWPSSLDKAEGLAIINDSTVAICNDNDYGQVSPSENGVATATGKLSHLLTYRFSGANKLNGFLSTQPLVAQGITGPSTSQSPYVLPAIAGAQSVSILTAGESVNGYQMTGVPDGTGIYDNGDNTFTLLLNHELGSTAGGIRAHGSKGAFVSKWIINKNDLSVISGNDLIQTVYTWNGSSHTAGTIAFSRFCSADLPVVSAFYNSGSGLGTQERIFMNGEETGNEGRAFGHIVTGSNAGSTYELPYLGKFSWENSVACPASQDKTIVAGLDDSTPGQVYIYVGNKTNSGTEIDKAGLNNGKLFGVSVTGLSAEVSASIPAPGTAFSLADLGQVQNLTGAQINTNSNNAGVTTFLRPEDGTWDPLHPEDFYFVTTNSFSNPSRLWKLHFTDINNPELGGTITALLDGTEGQKMLDNLTIDQYGHILMQEDVGNNVHLGKIWQYSIADDQLTLVATHDANRFISGGSNFLTQDEEASGMIDAQDILGQGHFIMVDQAHYPFPGNVVEGGQLLSFFNPATYNAAPNAFTVLGGGFRCFNGSGVEVSLSKSEKGVDYQLMLNGSTFVGNPVAGTGSPLSFGLHKDAGVYTIVGTNVLTNVAASMNGSAVISVNPAILVDAGPNKNVYAGYAPLSCASLAPVAVSGGVPAYSFSWSNGSTTSTTNVCPAINTTYVLTVTDAEGCKANDSVLVCVKNVSCDKNKVQVCQTIRVGDRVIAKHTHCVAPVSAGVLMALNTPTVEWNIGDCNLNTTCGTLVAGKTDEAQGDVGDEKLSSLEFSLIYGKASIHLYPNPNNNRAFVNLDLLNIADKDAQITVTNVLGQVVHQETITMEQHHMNKVLRFNSELAPGTYLVTYTSSENVISEKLIIQ